MKISTKSRYRFPSGMYSVVLVCLSIFLSSFSFAQSYKGKIVDKDGEGMVGVSIQIKGTSSGTVTDVNGSFELNAKQGDVVIISFVGYKTQELTLGSSTTLNLSLEEDVQSLSEVIVLGSRGLGRTATSSPVPVDAITAKELKSFSQVNVGDILNYVAPSFNSNRQTVTDGTDHIDPASLRGLGPDQVLVLVNGKRRHTSALVNINGSVGRGSVGTDMNVIPVASIERIEVLRDGAAAQYGSDAIAGVINVVLKKNYTGTSASLTTGMHMTNMKYDVPLIAGGVESRSEKINDGEVFQFDFSKGFKFNSKGGVTITAQYNERGRTNRSGLDNAPTIYLGTAGGFPATPTGQVTNTFRTQLITQDAQLVAQNNYDRHNMVFGNSSSRNLGLQFNGDYQLNEKSSIYYSGGYTFRNGKAFGNNRVPVSRAQQPLNSTGGLLYPNGFYQPLWPPFRILRLCWDTKPDWVNGRWNSATPLV